MTRIPVKVLFQAQIKWSCNYFDFWATSNVFNEYKFPKLIEIGPFWHKSPYRASVELQKQIVLLVWLLLKWLSLSSFKFGMEIWIFALHNVNFIDPRLVTLPVCLPASHVF